MLDMLNLFKFKDTKAKYLSGGNKRKLLIAIALIQSPKFVLLDEATTGLDPFSRRRLYEYLIKTSTTTLIVTQTIEDVEEYCDKVAVMIDGSIVEFGSIR